MFLQRLRPALLQRQLNVETSIEEYYCNVHRLPSEDDVAGLLSAYNEILHVNAQTLMTSATFKRHMQRYYFFSILFFLHQTDPYYSTGV